MGDQTLSWSIQRLIAAQADITPIRAALLADSHAVLQLIASFSADWERSNASNP